MDFFKSMLGRAAKEAGGDESLNAVFNRSQEVYREAVAVIQKASKEVYFGAKKEGRTDGAFCASLLIFLVVWQLVGWANNGVEPRRKEEGDEHPVVRLWDLLRAAFEKPGLDESLKAMEELTKKWGMPE